MFARASLLLPVSLPVFLIACAPAPGPAPQPQVAADQARWTQQCEDWDDWDKPGPPFRIHGNSYYVGTCGIGAILVTSDAGHILIDSGTDAGARVVAGNIQALGFALEDVKYILTSHEHFDHVGGIARLQALTGAQLITSAPAAEVFRSGEVALNDPQYGEIEGPARARVDRIVGGGDVVTLGPLSLTAIATPGHTHGALSWQLTARGGAETRQIVYADSLSPVSNDDYRFSDHPEYVQEYRDGLARLAAMSGRDCDILLTPHPSASGMRDKLLAGDLTASPTCAEYAASITTRLDARLAQETEQ
ncbi:HARLDQ motif MBL-fold protein [Alteraurantiacibacter aestuarii]|uniref:Subclass B3 metallo-beta-lactamase n=1 Tax=Alteraurantiacibacter aestuarii TaxID=650004 RepID=A0A844ZPR9_9SPHN|nr:subclass B3 metallo-beta-lactamase [Alteraurantiacibacter aestuarii]MXO87629.1 subclass B3 metallo-beta-lactamase [Alteraurantiacibacter aestuarii]